MSKLFEAKKTAVNYYQKIRSKTLVQGFVKYIAVHENDVLIINISDNIPSDVFVFKCETRNMEVYCELIS